MGFFRHGKRERSEMSKVMCVGVGHVGLPLSLKLWRASHDVSLVDIDEDKIEKLALGQMPFLEAGCDEILAECAGDARFTPLTYGHKRFAETVSGADYIVLTLGTPLGTDYTFRYDQYFDVLERMVPHLRQGVTLIVRSTVAPHFTHNVVTARIAAQRDWIPGTDFHVAFCPERLVQGEAVRGIDELPEIIGADDPETTAKADALFRSLGPNKLIHHVRTVEAELSKLFLNTFRYTLFGLANEFAIIAEQYDADMFEILRAANGGYPRGGIPRPGPSRGPCLGKDAATLAFSSTASAIAHAAIKTNENIVLHIAAHVRTALGSLSHRRITVLGMAFKPGTDDVRDNLTSPLLNVLDREGATTAVFDPLVAGINNPAILDGSEALVVMTPHEIIRDMSEDEVMRLCGRDRDEVFVYDMWNIWPWADRIFGKGTERTNEDTGDRRLRLAHAGGRTPAH
jgi:UDP-N-acetyl-D-mannosaminuronic acid dehydrogenase